MSAGGIIVGVQEDDRRYTAGLRKDDRLVKFKLQSRPYLSSIIGNVFIKPHSKTDVQAEIQEMKDHEGLPEFTKTLVNGVTVEVVGVCDHPSEGKQWWRPDGSLLEEAPYDNVFGRAFPKFGEKGYKFAVKLSGLSGADFNYRIMPLKFRTTQGGGGGWPSEKNGRKNVKYIDGSLDEMINWVGTSFAEEMVDCDIEVGVCFGDWKYKYKYETDKPNDGVEWVRFEKVSLRRDFKTEYELDERKQIAKQAESQARLLNHEYVGTEHILLALVAENSGIISVISEKFNIGRERIYNETLRVVKKEDKIVTKKTLPMTPRAQSVFKNADQWAKALNSDTVKSQHVLLGLLEVEDGVGGQVLMNLGLNLEKAQDAITHAEGLEDERKQFLEKHPDAHRVPSANIAVVQLELHVVEVILDVELDWETRVAASSITHAKIASNARSGKSFSAADILREAANTKAQAGNSVEKLIDLLASRGYLKILMNPRIEVLDGKTAKIRSSSKGPDGDEIVDSFEFTPRIRDDGNIDVAAKLVFQNKQMGDPRTHINIKDSGSLVIGSVTKTEKRAIVRDGVKGVEERTVEVLVILTPTIITPEMNVSKKHDVPVEVKGRVIGPEGEGIADVEVQIREKRKPGQYGIAAPEAYTDADGYYSFDEIEWSYKVGALWREDLANGKGFRHQYKGLNKYFEGSQSVDFKFDHFPSGDSAISGQVIDVSGEAIKDSIIDLRLKVDWKDRSGKYLEQYGYQIPPTTDGRFEVGDLPAGEYRVHIFNPELDPRLYVWPTKELVLDEGKTANVTLEVIKKPSDIYYGRILFEDGKPAVMDSAPWPGAKTDLNLSSLKNDAFSLTHFADVDNEGYFADYLLDEELEKLKAGELEIRIYYPSSEEEHVSSRVGIFPVEKLAKDKSKAGVVRIKRPENQKPAKPAVQVDAKTAESAEKLGKLNTAILMYADEHDGKYPDGIQALHSFLDAEDLNWLLIHVEYLGKGKTSDDLPTIVLAYDRTPAEEKPTNVLFNNNRVELVTAERLKKLGISRSEIQIETRYVVASETFIEDIGLDPNSVFDANAWP